MLRGDVNVLAIGAAMIGLITGILSRLGTVETAEAAWAAMLAEFPVVADLLALAVVAGEAPGNALMSFAADRRQARPDIDLALSRSGREHRLPEPSLLSDRTTLEPFARFLQGLVVAIERGAPMADVLRAQAADARASKRALLRRADAKKFP